VRKLQEAFYRPDSSDSYARLGKDTGRVLCLPLWRVGWTELPGRANCLNVHEPQYTHMFETVLAGPAPWYVGRLCLPGGFRMARTGAAPFVLTGCREELDDADRASGGGAECGGGVSTAHHRLQTAGGRTAGATGAPHGAVRGGAPRAGFSVFGGRRADSARRRGGVPERRGRKLCQNCEGSSHREIVRVPRL